MIYSNAAGIASVGTPAAAAMIKCARVELPPMVSLLQKDSRDMNADDRAAVVAAAANSAASRLVITHGTDTMMQTARTVLAAKVNKTVVFVGAFLPAAMKDSDADFNVGFALAAAKLLPAGVYIAMNGCILPAAQAIKNVAAGRFEQTDGG